MTCVFHVSPGRSCSAEVVPNTPFCLEHQGRDVPVWGGSSKVMEFVITGRRHIDYPQMDSRVGLSMLCYQVQRLTGDESAAFESFDVPARNLDQGGDRLPAGTKITVKIEK